MSLPTRTAAALARSVAVVTLIAAAPAIANAQTHSAPTSAPTSPAKPAATSAEQGKGVEQQITQLHSELKITSDQESKWNSVAQAMRDNAANLQKLIGEKQQQAPSNLTAVDALETNQQLVQAHLDGLKNFTSAFKSLYDSMSDPQKKTADQLFARMNRTPQQGATPNRNG